MSRLMPQTASVSDIQRDYRGVINKANKTRKPVVLLRRNKPVGVVVDVATFEAMREVKKRWEEEDTRRAIATAEGELKSGKLKVLESSLVELMDKRNED